MFLVICLDDNRYHLATHTMFHVEKDADTFKSTIASNRLPRVVTYDGKPLRDDAKERGAAFNADGG